MSDPRFSHELPHDPERCDAQLRGVRALLKGRVCHVLDIGCGDGRLLVPLAEDGHSVHGVDTDREALKTCEMRLKEANVHALCLYSDFLNDCWRTAASTYEMLRQSGGSPPGGHDAVLLLGNTLMTVVEIDTAMLLFRRMASLVKEDTGVVLIDDMPHDFWPELTEGNWTSGISEDGTMQIVWHRAEPIFTIRHGDRVDPDSWNIRPDDPMLRLWTLDLLRLVAREAGLSEPQHYPEWGLIAFHLAWRSS